MSAAPLRPPSHFERLFQFETDCWDVHAALAFLRVSSDVRSPEFFRRGHIAGAVSLPHGRVISGTSPTIPRTRCSSSLPVRAAMAPTVRPPGWRSSDRSENDRRHRGMEGRWLPIDRGLRAFLVSVRTRSETTSPAFDADDVVLAISDHRGDARARGVGASVFAVVNGTMLRPLPFPDQDRLVRVFTCHRARPSRSRNPAACGFHRFREGNPNSRAAQ